MKTKTARGFARLSKERRREISSRGGKVAHERGTAYVLTSKKAQEIGRLGGLAVSKNKKHMADIGRRRWQNQK